MCSSSKVHILINHEESMKYSGQPVILFFDILVLTLLARRTLLSDLAQILWVLDGIANVLNKNKRIVTIFHLNFVIFTTVQIAV